MALIKRKDPNIPEFERRRITFIYKNTYEIQKNDLNFSGYSLEMCKIR
jgi:hypothetical protein